MLLPPSRHDGSYRWSLVPIVRAQRAVAAAHLVPPEHAAAAVAAVECAAIVWALRTPARVGRVLGTLAACAYAPQALESGLRQWMRREGAILAWEAVGLATVLWCVHLRGA